MNNIKIEKLIRSRRRTIALIISPDATLTVRAPIKATMEYINRLVWQKRAWIIKRKNHIFKHGGPTKAKEFVDNEKFLYLGKAYPLQINNSKKIELSHCLYFPTKYFKNARAKMTEWYIKEARKKIAERVRHWSKITGWQYKSISINQATTRWGSCGYHGSLNFTWRLIMAPMGIVDYVVVHELAHTMVKNHSEKFWTEVQKFFPDYKIRRKWLKDNGRHFVI